MIALDFPCNVRRLIAGGGFSTASCFCITGDVEWVHEQLQNGADPGSGSISCRVCRFLSPAPRWIAWSQRSGQSSAPSGLPEVRRQLLDGAGPIAQIDHGPAGAFMGYDFHVEGDGPRLIEINTNAGGAAINALSSRRSAPAATPWIGS